MIEHATHIANNGTRRFRTEGDNLSHPSLTVFFRYIFDSLAAFFVAEVNIDIRHADTFRIQKAFKEKIIFERVKAGNAEQIGHHGTGRTTTTRPY